MATHQPGLHAVEALHARNKVFCGVLDTPGAILRAVQARYIVHDSANESGCKSNLNDEFGINLWLLDLFVPHRDLLVFSL